MVVLSLERRGVGRTARWGSRSRALSAALADGLDDGLVEGRNVVGVAAEDELAVGHDLLIHPVGAGVLQVGFQRGPRCDRLALQRARVDQRPRAVTDGRDRLSRSDELAGGGGGLWVHAGVVA